MNVYDFDHTIYDGDSTMDFYFFCLRRHPSILFILPEQLWGAAMYKVGRIPKTRFKEIFFGFLQKLKNVDQDVALFWNIREKRIQNWYLSQKRNDDLIISASPYFLLKEICGRLQIQYLIASSVNPETGTFEGDNCYGEEKLRKFRKVFPDAEIDKFYSDSVSDMPLAKIAHASYLVRKSKITSWKL